MRHQVVPLAEISQQDLRDSQAGRAEAGYAAKEARRRLNDRVPPFVFVTGVAASKLQDISGTFLTKPIEIDQLLRVVAQHCERTT